jgi:hypothetical protein
MKLVDLLFKSNIFNMPKKINTDIIFITIMTVIDRVIEEDYFAFYKRESKNDLGIIRLKNFYQGVISCRKIITLF